MQFSHVSECRGDPCHQAYFWVPEAGTMPVRLTQTPTTYRLTGAQHRHRVIGRLCGGFRMPGPCRTPPQPPGPAYESPQGRNPREAGHRELHNAMRISPPPSACERLAARLERCTGLRGNAQRQPRQRESRAGTAGSRLAEAPIASVAMRLDERRRGRHISGGEGGQQSEWKRAQSCS